MVEVGFTHGIEQEIQVVDQHTGELRNKVKTILNNLKGSWSANIIQDYYDTQLEIRTGINEDFGQIKKGLPNLREKSYSTAKSCKLGLIATGINPISPTQTPTETFGEHHHVGVEDAKEKVRVHNMLRNFIPELMALTVNSPFYRGYESGFMSTRVFRSTHIKLPPRLSIDTYKEWLSNPKAVESKFGGKIRFWDVTPFTEDNLPTVEVRLFDTQLDVSYSLAIAVFLESIALKAKKMSAEDIAPPTVDREVIKYNREQAVYNGLKATFRVDRGVKHLDTEMFPYQVGEKEIPAIEAVYRLLEYVDEELDEIGGKEDIGPILEILKDGKSPAEKQIEIAREKDVLYLAQKLMKATEKGRL